VAQEQRPNEADALAWASGLDRMRLSKFQPCLPTELEVRYLADSLSDVSKGVPKQA
jgi:hypothetical protein